MNRILIINGGSSISQRDHVRHDHRRDQESRKISERMNGYVIYRIAEAIRVLLFATLSILVLDFIG